MKHDFSSYREAVAFLEGLANLPRRPAAPGGHLARTRRLLERLGHPEHDFKYVHVTGTAGKGSVATQIHADLVASGRRAGLFISPFATTSIEKITVGTEYIDPQSFVAIVSSLKPHLDAMQEDLPGYFELFFAIALLYFRQCGCEWAVIEVGIGGRFDATNCIPPPVASTVTNIGYDHTALLGKTLVKIARDKAGIIKKGSDFFTTEHRPALRRIFREACEEAGAAYHGVRVGTSMGYAERNAALTEAIAAFLGLEKRAGAVRLPCRFEVVQKEPLVILDGAHNGAKIDATLDNLADLKYEKLITIFGAAADKDWRAMLDRLAPRSAAVIGTRYQVGTRTCVAPAEIAVQTGGESFLDPARALDRALELAGPQDAVLVTGSFYLAGELRERWYPEECVLERRRSW